MAKTGVIGQSFGSTTATDYGNMPVVKLGFCKEIARCHRLCGFKT